MASIPKDPFAKPVLIGASVLLGTAVLVLVSNLFSTIEKNSTKGAEDNSMYTAAADNNIQAIGHTVAVDKSIAPKARTGEQVYNAVCTSCHTGGVLNAPKLEKAAWDTRIAKGMKGLLDSAINGLNQMPARGGDPSITDQELTDAILYMMGKAGHNLSDGAAAPAAQAPAATQAAQAPTAAQAAAPAAQAPTATPAAAPVASISGESIYKSICFSCHDVGIANSPRLDDKAAWSTRIAAGKDSLYNHAINGLNIMPPKGGNPALSDEEVKAAVDWMLSHLQ